MSDTYETASVSFVEGCIGNAQEHLNRALNASGLLGLENDCWAALYLEIGKALRSLERARTRVIKVRSRRLDGINLPGDGPLELRIDDHLDERKGA